MYKCEMHISERTLSELLRHIERIKSKKHIELIGEPKEQVNGNGEKTGWWYQKFYEYVDYRWDEI